MQKPPLADTRIKAYNRDRHGVSPGYKAVCATSCYQIERHASISLKTAKIEELSPDYFPDELRMNWRCARELRRDIDQEPQTYRVVRLAQPEGSPYWEIEVKHRPTGEVFCLRWWAEWAERVRWDAGY